ncbi:MAG: exodeoxyribonuclease VII large subunit [Deltaproteobacteria bacterium]|nr:MAG: exodeoxyribonuclease VII large subunit [Deltaproteobacteria bacterium]
MQPPSAQKHILTVSELTLQIKSQLETRFPFIWITGEISNFRVPVSGHFYFSLKDSRAQINAVMFRGQNSHLKFEPEDGMQINGIGRISLYEPRGTYQIILEYMEPSGVGALQVAFEQLKQKLSSEGLFNDEHKLSIPFLPNKISVITSLTGSVIHDILRVLNRRFANIPLEIIPARVQGDDAEKELIDAIRLLNERRDADVAILARGGGSLEDLQPFNTEGLAREIFASKIPIISAVGHETDFTLADFVADLRVPTPSAAAEIVAPLKTDLEQQCIDLQRKLMTTFSNYLRFLKTYLKEFSKRLIDPRKKIQDLRLRTDDLTNRCIRACRQDIRQRRERLRWRMEKLQTFSPTARLPYLKSKHEQLYHNLLSSMYNNLMIKNSNLHANRSKLSVLSPMAILERGYSITRSIPGAQVIRDAESVATGDRLQILLGIGSLEANVTKNNKP